MYEITSSDEGETVWNVGVDYHVGDGGEIRSYGVQTVNLDATVFSNGYGHVGRDATLKVYDTPLGGLLSKYRFDVSMDGPGGDAFIGGVYFPNQDQHVDMRTVQHHHATQAHSLTLYKGAITDEAHSVYQGLIAVDHEALNTDAYLTNNNLLLSDSARADSIPTLEINTDEVRCSHGSTIGKLNADQLFYLKTRGYSDDQARHELVLGFLEEVLSAYPEALHKSVSQVVEGRIASVNER